MKHIIISKQAKSIFDFIIRAKVILIAAALLLGNNFAKGQPVTQNYEELEAYVLTKKANGAVYLSKKSPFNTAWVEVGNTNKTDLQCLSIHPVSNIIYAVSNGEFGTVNKGDGSFNAIGAIGNGDGANGNIVFDNIYGLSYSNIDKVLYASHRRDGHWYGSEDILIQINPNTGALIKNSFEDANGNPTDYAVTEVLEHGNGGTPPSGDIIDISFDPVYDELKAIYSNGDMWSLTSLNVENGKVNTHDFDSYEPIAGFRHAGLHTYDAEGHELFIVTSEEENDGSTSSSLNTFLYYNIKPFDSLPSALDFDFVKNPVTNSPTYTDLEGYIVAEKADGLVYLYTSDSGEQNWTEIGNTNRTDIHSLSIHPTNNTIYAVSNGELGILSKVDGSFNPVGTIGSGDGELGNIIFDNIYALTHSYEEEALFASQRVDNYVDDILIKISSETGELIKDSFIDSNGNPTDYVRIESAFTSGNQPENKDVVDLFINPVTDELFVLQIKKDEYTLGTISTYTALSIINSQEGHIEFTLLDIEEPLAGGCFDVHNYSYYGDYEIYTVNEANFDDANGPVESMIKRQNQLESPFILDMPLQGLSVRDFDYVKSSCVANLTIKENATTGLNIYPYQRSSQTIITEQTNSPDYDVSIYDQTLNLKSNHITLQAGFMVAEGATLNAVIEPCE